VFACFRSESDTLFNINILDSSLAEQIKFVFLCRNLIRKEMDVIVRNISQSDVNFFEEFIKRMGWAFKTKENVLEKFIETRPENVDLTDNEIVEEIRSIRYAE